MVCYDQRSRIRTILLLVQKSENDQLASLHQCISYLIRQLLTQQYHGGMRAQSSRLCHGARNSGALGTGLQACNVTPSLYNYSQHTEKVHTAVN